MAGILNNLDPKVKAKAMDYMKWNPKLSTMVADAAAVDADAADESVDAPSSLDWEAACKLVKPHFDEWSGEDKLAFLSDLFGNGNSVHVSNDTQATGQ